MLERRAEASVCAALLLLVEGGWASLCEVVLEGALPLPFDSSAIALYVFVTATSLKDSRADVGGCGREETAILFAVDPDTNSLA